jgi:hypothetical protein
MYSLCASALRRALNGIREGEWKKENGDALPYHLKEPRTPTIQGVTW